MKNLKRIFARSASAMLIGFMPCTGAGETQVETRTRIIVPSAATTTQFVDAIRASPRVAQHGLVWLSKHPAAAQRNALRRHGIHLLDPYQRTTYFARVEKRIDLETLRRSGTALQLVPLRPEDRAEPHILRGDLEKYVVTLPGGQPRNYVLNPDGTLNLAVSFQMDVQQGHVKRVLERHVRSSDKQSDRLWFVVAPRSAVRRLAEEDIVKWIDAGPLPFVPNNDVTRAEINVDAAQDFMLENQRFRGLSGQGVNVAVFEEGIDETHRDLAPAVLLGRPPAFAHGTHVAGIILGRGTLSDGTDNWGIDNGGTPFQYRGMAPRAGLIEADDTDGADAAVYLDFIANHGMDLSNHSYQLSADGRYGSQSETRDRLVRGDETSNGIPVPGRLQVGSAGNNGQLNEDLGEQVGYFSLSQQVKNGLAVGNWHARPNQIVDSSSLGPAHDGRIKPDVIAPGSFVMSTGFCRASEGGTYCPAPPGGPTPRRNFYRLMLGTSMAAPATTGAIALVLEQYAKTFRGLTETSRPLPSTLRAIMIHAATDIHASDAWFDNPDGPVRPTPGPDFVTGWGLIDARQSASIVARRLMFESRIDETCDFKRYRFQVSAGETKVRATLAWDDVAGNPALPDTSPRLVNDLDLVLVDPQRQIHFPWQLDQTIVDSSGNRLANERQECNTEITVRRSFNPAEEPNFVEPGSPDNVLDVVPGGGVPAAVRGRDHLNNVEVVDAPAIPGTWQAVVVGFSVPQGPQRFSLIRESFADKTGLFFYRPGRGDAWVARSNGDGSFAPTYSGADEDATPSSGIAGYDLLSEQDRVVVFDFNNDDRDDLFFYRPGRGAAWVARSDGFGAFAAVPLAGDNGIPPPNGVAGYDMLSEDDLALRMDFNGDGNDDLFFYRPGGGAAWVAKSNGDGTFTRVHPPQVSGGGPIGMLGYDFASRADRALVFDFNGDKRDDLFFYRPGQGAAWVVRSNGDGTFTAVHQTEDNGSDDPNGLAGYNLLSPSDRALVFDFNGDQRDDLFFYRPGRGAAWIAKSDGDGTFTQVHPVGDNGAAPPNGIAEYDLLSTSDRVMRMDYNGDGRDDLFLYRPGLGAAWVARSNGDGTFTQVYAVGDNGAAPPNGIAGYDLLSPSDQVLVFDHNGDGFDDLFLYRPGRGAAWVAQSNGAGKFLPVFVVGDDGPAAPNGIAGYDLLSERDRAFAVR